ncbi:MAG: phosphoadenosine phosphosulfate reductase family protein, partial [Prevotellaceae bacterium]|nr:phosphoadenosine phosphosulfate reductase family protein [Prevotellaceae bacterium]
MWAESNLYYYRGRLVAKTKGGNLYTAPEIIIPEEPDDLQKPEGPKHPVAPEPDGGKLRPIDITLMIKKNREMLDIIEQTTVKKILDIYNKYTKKLDVFHVAFSGGKDSMVLLDLVKKALPKGSFVVVFGDTGMEFPDTYDVIDKIEKQCEEEDIVFRRAKSHLDTKKSWELFGSPSRALRWCCSVHKSTPQTLELRRLTGKNDYVGLDFVGVRAYESVKRSEYQYENFGKKQKGQYSHNSILEWTSAEIWLYSYTNGLVINEAYKKGNSRAGCLLCPMSSGVADYFRRQFYTDDIDSFVDVINRSNGREKGNKKALKSYIVNGGWNARKNGRDLDDNLFRCIEKETDSYFTIEIIKPLSDWKEWIKTIGNINLSGYKYGVYFEDKLFYFSVKNTKNGYTVSIAMQIICEYPTFGKLFRQVFRKASYCKGCKVCETNCRSGCIAFDEKENVKISNCIHCRECHSIDSGCLLFHSLRHLQGDGKPMKSLNSFADHAPKPEWLNSFFEFKEDFFTRHTLGPMMFDIFRRFLRDASLMEKNHFTVFAELISKIGWETETAWALILTNLAVENPQIQWYIKNMEVGHDYRRKTVEDMLTGLEVKEKDAKSIVKSFKRLVETPLGTKLNFGYVTDEGNLVRTTCVISDSRVILYALYKFAEKCNGYWQFTLTRLLDHSVISDGLSPTEIFGLNREAMEPILLGLSAKYPDYISASFTH